MEPTDEQPQDKSKSNVNQDDAAKVSSMVSAQTEKEKIEPVIRKEEAKDDHGAVKEPYRLPEDSDS